jgi:hypothetical protein
MGTIGTVGKRNESCESILSESVLASLSPSRLLG